MLVDNSHHLAAAAHQRHDDAYQRAEEAIRVAAARGEALSATRLATHAGVSRAFLYANPDLINAIRQLRSARGRPGAAPTRERATEASLLLRLATLTERNKQLRTENQDLRRRLETVYGRLRAADMSRAPITGD